METLFYYVIAMIVSAVISNAMRPKPKDAEPAKFGDFKLPQADEGTPQCVFFGDCWTADWMVLGYGNFSTYPIYAEDAEKK